MFCLFSVSAQAELVDWPLNKTLDIRCGYTDEEIALSNYMSYCFNSYETEDTSIYFSTRETELCKYPVPGRENVYMSIEIKDFVQPTTKPSTMPFFGHSLSIFHDKFVYPYCEIDRKLIEVFGTDITLRYVLEDQLNDVYDPEAFYKTKIDIGKKTITLYVDMELTDEQSKLLLKDSTLDTIYVYIIIVAATIIVVTGIVILIIIYTKKEKARKEAEREKRRLEKRRRKKKHKKHKHRKKK
jgi:hypothetical protein